MTAARCPTCDKPRGDQDRADSLPITRRWSAWVASKPGEQRPMKWTEVQAAQAADQPGMCIEGQCHAVDWRARALTAEARIATVTATIEHDIAVCRGHQAARATGGQTCGTGGALTAAQPSMLAYLERAVRDLRDTTDRAAPEGDAAT